MSPTSLCKTSITFALSCSFSNLRLSRQSIYQINALSSPPRRPHPPPHPPAPQAHRLQVLHISQTHPLLLFNPPLYLWAEYRKYDPGPVFNGVVLITGQTVLLLSIRVPCVTTLTFINISSTCIPDSDVRSQSSASDTSAIVSWKTYQKLMWAAPGGSVG